MMYGMAGEADSLGKRIRLARQRKHLTQEALGKLVGKSVRAVNDWENDRTSPKNSQGPLEDVLDFAFDDDGTQGLPSLVADNDDLDIVMFIWNTDRLPKAERLYWIRNWLGRHHPERLPADGRTGTA
jgi:hypothetical protein